MRPRHILKSFKNHGEAIGYVEQLAAGDSKITASDIRRIHHLVLTKIDDENAGRYRQAAVRIAGARHAPPGPWDVSSRMDQFVKWLRSHEANHMNPLEKAARAHHKFVAIHPFVDGNGRTGRLLLNLLLFRDGYPPAVIEQTARKTYYKVLAEADGGNVKGLVNLVARACERSLRTYVEATKTVKRTPSSDDRWIALSEAAIGSQSQSRISEFAGAHGQAARKKAGPQLGYHEASNTRVFRSQISVVRIITSGKRPGRDPGASRR